MKSYPRDRRLSSLLREGVAPLLREHCAPELLLTVRHVTLASDFSAADIHFTVATGDPDKVAIELQEASPQIRRRLASTLNLRATPTLRFIPDAQGRASDRLRNFLEKTARGESN